jgi:hypothetical protein
MSDAYRAEQLEAKYTFVRVLYQIRRTNPQRLGFLRPSFIHILFGDHALLHARHGLVATLPVRRVYHASTGVLGNCMVVDQVQERLYSGCEDKTIGVWDIRKHKLVEPSTDRHTSWIRCLVHNGDQTLYSGSGDGMVRVWNTTYPAYPTLMLKDVGLHRYNRVCRNVFSRVTRTTKRCGLFRWFRWHNQNGELGSYSQLFHRVCKSDSAYCRCIMHDRGQ